RPELRRDPGDRLSPGGEDGPGRRAQPPSRAYAAGGARPFRAGRGPRTPAGDRPAAASPRRSRSGREAGPPGEADVRHRGPRALLDRVLEAAFLIGRDVDFGDGLTFGHPSEDFLRDLGE